MCLYLLLLLFCYSWLELMWWGRRRQWGGQEEVCDVCVCSSTDCVHLSKGCMLLLHGVVYECCRLWNAGLVYSYPGGMETRVFGWDYESAKPVVNPHNIALYQPSMYSTWLIEKCCSYKPEALLCTLVVTHKLPLQLFNYYLATH